MLQMKDTVPMKSRKNTDSRNMHLKDIRRQHMKIPDMSRMMPDMSRNMNRAMPNIGRERLSSSR